MLTAGNKVLISHRRLFKNDEPRYFLGEVTAYEAGIVKLNGFSFVWDMTGGKFIKKNQRPFSRFRISFRYETFRSDANLYTEGLFYRPQRLIPLTDQVNQVIGPQERGGGYFCGQKSISPKSITAFPPATDWIVRPPHRRRQQ